MKAKKLFLFSFSICMSITLTAQKNYQAGSVVLMNGDTLKGFIDYRNWERNPELIHFKTTEAGTERSFSLEDIKAFETGNDHYVRAVVVKDMLPVNSNSLEIEGVQKMVNDTVFLRSIIRSEKLSLYELIDDKAHYYIQQRGGEYEELIYRIYLRKEDRNISIKRETYKDQLKRFALNDNALQRAIDNSAYDERSLSSIVRSLNADVVDGMQNTGSSVRKSRFLAGAGISMNKINFDGVNEDLTVLKENFTPGIYIGAGIDLLTKRDFQRLFFRFMVSYRTMNYKGEAITNGPLTNQVQKKQYDLKMSIINPAGYIFYSVWRNQVSKLQLGLGAGYNVTNYPTNRFTTTDQNTGDVSKQDNYLLVKNWADFHGKLGYVIKNSFEVELDARIIGSFTDYQRITSQARSYTVAVHKYF